MGIWVYGYMGTWVSWYTRQRQYAAKKAAQNSASQKNLQSFLGLVSGQKPRFFFSKASLLKPKDIFLWTIFLPSEAMSWYIYFPISEL